MYVKNVNLFNCNSNIKNTELVFTLDESKLTFFVWGLNKEEPELFS